MNDQNNYLSTKLHFFEKVSDYKSVKNNISVLDYLTSYIKEGRHGLKEKTEAIQKKIIADDSYRFSSEYKENDKIEFPCVVPHATFIDNIKKHNLRDFTGLIFLDFDGLTKEEVQQLIEMLNKMPAIVAAYQSLSMHGVHAIMSITGIKTLEDYHRAHHQLTMLFYSQIGFNLCQGSNLPTQLVILAYYPQLTINKKPKPYPYVFDQVTENEFKTKFKSKDSKSLTININHWLFEPDVYQQTLEYYNYKFGSSYYSSLIMFDMCTGEPVLFPTDKDENGDLFYKNVKYDASKHSFKKYFSEEIILKHEKRNKTNTLAILPGKGASIGINMWNERRFNHGKRGRIITRVLLEYAFQCKILKKEVFVLDLYCLAQVLNKRCITNHIDKIYFPLNNDELQAICTKVNDLNKANEIMPEYNQRTIIYTKDMVAKCRQAKTDSIKTIILKEYNSIKWGNSKQNNIEMVLKYLKDIPIGLNHKQVVIYIHQQTNLNKNKIRDILRKKQIGVTPSKNVASIIKGGNTLRMIQKPKLLPLLKKDLIEGVLNDLIQDGVKITKKRLANRLMVTEQYIKTIWKPFKTEIEFHNKSVKENKNMSKKVLKQGIKNNEKESHAVIQNTSHNGNNLLSGAITYKMQVLWVNPSQESIIHKFDSAENCFEIITEFDKAS